MEKRLRKIIEGYLDLILSILLISLALAYLIILKIDLTLIGLAFNSIGASILLLDFLFSYGKPKPFSSIIWNRGKIERVVRYGWDKGGGIIELSRSREEKLTILSLILLIIGFLLQIVGYFL
jgi:hypothetical protein